MNEEYVMSAVRHYEVWSGVITLIVGIFYYVRRLYSTLVRFEGKSIVFDGDTKRLKRYDKFIRVHMSIIFIIIIVICAFIFGKNSSFPISLVLSGSMALIGMALLYWNRKVAPHIKKPKVISSELSNYFQKLDRAQVYVGSVCFLITFIIIIGPNFSDVFLNLVDRLWVRALSNGTTIGGAFTISVVGLLHVLRSS